MSRIILKSNDSLKYYPNNKSSDFTVKIPNLSSIGHNLEVALTEITFPFGFKNVREGYNRVDFILATDNSKKLTSDDEIMSSVNFRIKPDFYNPTSLIDEINAQINNETIKLELEIMNKQGLVTISSKIYPKMSIGTLKMPDAPDPPKGNVEVINDGEPLKPELKINNNQGLVTINRKIHLKFGLDIAKILGFNVGEWLTFGPEKLISPNPAGAYKNMSLLNVYCDIVEESLIGENHHQLLRIVNWNYSKKNDFVFNPSITYHWPYFIPVKNTNLNSIEIKITDSLNIPVEFIGDEPVVIILEFRKGK